MFSNINFMSAYVALDLRMYFSQYSLCLVFLSIILSFLHGDGTSNKWYDPMFSHARDGVPLE